MVKIKDSITSIDLDNYDNERKNINDFEIEESEWIQTFALILDKNLNTSEKLKVAQVKDLRNILNIAKSTKKFLKQKDLDKCITCNKHHTPVQSESNFSYTHREAPKISIHSTMTTFESASTRNLEVGKIYCPKCIPDKPKKEFSESNLPVGMFTPEDTMIIELTEKVTPILHYRPGKRLNEELYRENPYY